MIRAIAAGAAAGATMWSLAQIEGRRHELLDAAFKPVRPLLRKAIIGILDIHEDIHRDPSSWRADVEAAR